MQDPLAEKYVNIGLHIQLLGGFAVSVDGATIPEEQWHLRRARNLVKLLALTPTHRLHRDQVIDTLWPDSDLSAAINNFHQTLYAARRVLEAAGANALALEEGFLRLEVGTGQVPWVDVDQFEMAAAGAKACPDPNVFQAALRLYRGDLLPDDLYEEWTIQRREALCQVYLKLLLDLAHLYEERQEYSSGIETLQRLLASDRSSEEAQVELMRLYALSGERAQALRQYQTLREALREEFEAEPSESTTQLYNEIRSGSFSTAPPKAVPPHNLPAQLTSFIGREKQIEEVRRLVRESRLVTLTGAGGTGKTRLALQAAGGLLGDFSNGAFLVELAPLSDPQLVPQACVKTLEVIQSPGVSLPDLLAHYLEQKSLLLILDNCEHVISACTHLADMLLKACPRLHILATSREILSVPGESPFRVPSLEVSNPLALPPLAEMAQVEAVQLFIERAAQAAPGFRLAEANAGAVAQIGQRLDGIPLAIELAAARTRVLTAGQIAARLDNAFHLLTGGSRAELPRHQTLKAMIDWSYNLLSPTERLLLQRLSVFAGGWDLEAAEAVCAQDGISTYDVLDLLTELVDKSLVLAEPRGEGVRYRMLELIRQYAHDRLLEAGGSEQARDRHLDYYAGLTGQAEPHLRGQGQVEWLARLDEELDNLRAALEWSMAGRVELGLKIMADLMWFWWIRGWYVEGAGWIERLLAAEASLPGSAPAEAAGGGKPARGDERALQYARGLRAYVYLTRRLYSLSIEQRLALIEESVAVLRGLAPVARRELGISLSFLWVEDETIKRPHPYLEEMLEFFRQENELFYYAEYLFNGGGSIPIDLGGCKHNEALLEESLAICREIGDLDGVSGRLKNLAIYALFAGNYARAEALIQEASVLSRKVRNLNFELILQQNLANILLGQGRYEEAAQVAEAGLRIEREINFRYGICVFLNILQITAWSRGDYASANLLGREIIELYPEVNDFVIRAYFYQGRAALSQGDLAQAEALFRQAASLFVIFRDNYDDVMTEGWGVLFARQGKLFWAVRFLGAADDFYRVCAPSFAPRVRSEHEDALQAARCGLGEEAFAAAFAAAWQEGQKLTFQQYTAMALAETG